MASTDPRDHHSRISAAILAALVLGATSAPTRATAQESGAQESGAQDAVAQDAAERRVDRARTAFADGVALVQTQRFAEAEALFREALALRDAPAIRYNLASVLFEQGEYPEALVHADAALADASAPPAVREPAAALRTQIAERAGYARVELTGAGAAVAIDGYALRDPAAEIPLAPGAHEASASRDDRVLARQRFEIATGEHRVVELDTSEPEPIAADVGPIDDAAPPPLHEEWWFWTAIGGGVVVVALVVGIAVGVSSGGVEQPLAGDFEPGVLRW